MKTGIAFVSGLAAACAATASFAGGATTSISTVDGYRSTADSPAFISGFGDSTFVNDLEDGLLTDGLGLTGSGVRVVGNSVEADGAGGHSLAVGSWVPFTPAAVGLSFSAKVLGGFPGFAAFAVTDASGVEDLVGNAVAIDLSLVVHLEDGTIFTQVVPVLSQPNDVNDDTLVVVESTVGISRIDLSSATPVSIDHIQYSSAAALATSFVRDDLDGDGKSDLVWTNADSSACAGWLMDGLVRRSGGPTSEAPTGGSVIVGLGDIDANRRADIFWRDTTTGALSVWNMDGTSVSAQAPISGPLSMAWDVIGIADLNGDRRADILFRDAQTGEVRGWLMDGTTRLDGAMIGASAGLEFVGAGDLDADGREDLVWRDDAGVMYAWMMDGLDILSASVIANVSPVSDAWKAIALADLDGDGRADIVWENRAIHSVHAWLMNGPERRSGGSITTTLGLGWCVLTTGDLNGDGRDDIVWRNERNGDVNAWLMDGIVKIDGGFVRNAPISWKCDN
jgi:hypothetical protein